MTFPSLKPSLLLSTGFSPPLTITVLIGSPSTPSANKSILFLVSRAPSSAEEILTERLVDAVAKNDPSFRLKFHFLYEGEKLEPAFSIIETVCAEPLAISKNASDSIPSCRNPRVT